MKSILTAVVMVVCFVTLSLLLYNDIQESKRKREYVMDNCIYTHSKEVIYIGKGFDGEGVRTYYKCPDGEVVYYDEEH